MIPVLYDKTETEFKSWGMMPLSDILACKVTEERNGDFLLEMTISVNSNGFKYLATDRIIKARCKDYGHREFSDTKEQPFRVYYISKPINGRVTVKAEHIARAAMRNIVFPPQAYDMWNGYNSSQHDQRGWADVQRTGATAYLTMKDIGYDYNTDPFIWGKHSMPWSGKDYMQGVEGSLVDRNHCEYDYHNYNIYACKNRGSVKLNAIRYGLNMTGFKMEEDILQTYTGVFPFYYKNENGVETYVAGDPVYGQNRSAYAEDRLMLLDCTSDYSNSVPTAAQLTSKGRAYIQGDDFGVPKINLSVDVIPTWEAATGDSDMSLCDTVPVVFERLGVTATAKIIKTEYDVLKERVTKITLGNEKISLPKRLAKVIRETGVTI